MEKGPKPWSNQVALPPQKTSTRESKWCVLRIAGKEEAPVCEGAEVWEDHVQAFPRSQLEQENLVEEVSFTQNGHIGEWIFLPPPSSASLGLAPNVKNVVFALIRSSFVAIAQSALLRVYQILQLTVGR